MFCEIAGETVHVASFGSGEPRIVGIPGSFGTWEIWQQPFELLSERYRTIAFEHFGTGETHVARDRVRFSEQIELAREVIERFAPDGCVLAGDSSMGAVAVETAVRDERVLALVLVSTGVSYAPDEGTRRFVEGLRTDFDATVDAFVAICLPEDSGGHLRQWLKDIISRTGAERAAHIVESFYDVDVADALPAVTVPTLVIHGERDVLPTSRASAAEEIARTIADCRLEILPGVGHVPTLSRPGEVAELISEFITRACGGRA